jgi:hypothetical protein
MRSRPPQKNRNLELRSPAYGNVMKPNSSVRHKSDNHHEHFNEGQAGVLRSQLWLKLAVETCCTLPSLRRMLPSLVYSDDETISKS